jgi:transcriptional regulator with XRE-family HTH domain
MKSRTFYPSFGGVTHLPRASKQEATNERGIGRRLREIRKRRGKTQTEVAEALGVDQSLVSAYERGAVRPNAPTLATLAGFLRTSADQILGLKESKENGLMRDRRFLRRLEQIDRLPRRKRDALLTTIDAFLKEP